MMFLSKVTDLSEINLAPNCILVELVKRESQILIPGENGEPLPSTTEISHVEVIKTTAPRFEVGDLIVDTRGGAMTYSGYHEVGKKKYAIIVDHDVKAWISPKFFDKNKRA